MTIRQLTVVFVFFGAMFAMLVAIAPSEQMYPVYDMLIDRTYRFIDALIHVLGVAALIKYLGDQSA